MELLFLYLKETGETAIRRMESLEAELLRKKFCIRQGYAANGMGTAHEYDEGSLLQNRKSPKFIFLKNMSGI